MKKLYPELSDRELIHGFMHPEGKLVAENPDFSERSRQKVRKLADGVSKDTESWEHVGQSSEESNANMAKTIRNILDLIDGNNRFMDIMGGISQYADETGKDLNEAMGDVAHTVFGGMFNQKKPSD